MWTSEWTAFITHFCFRTDHYVLNSNQGFKTFLCFVKLSLPIKGDSLPSLDLISFIVTLFLDLPILILVISQNHKSEIHVDLLL